MNKNAERGRKYRNPPVVESLCEIFFDRSDWDDTVPGRFYDAVKEDFPNKRRKDIQEAQVSFMPTGEAAAGVRNLPSWMQFTTTEGDRMVQVGRDLLVVNQLRPYPSFEDWEPFIHRSVKVYRDLAQPKAIMKIGMRYINKISLPGPHVNMGDFFDIYPQIPGALGQHHGLFMIRVEIPSPETGHSLLLTFGSAPKGRPEDVTFLLDIYDVYQPEVSFSPDVIKQHLNIAHGNLEKAFEGSITDRLRKHFEPEGQP